MERRALGAVGLGCGIGIICALAGLFIIATRGLENLVQPAGVALDVSAPENAVVGDDIILEIRVTNRSSDGRPVTLHSVDISEAYLGGMTVKEVAPAAERVVDLPVVDFQTYLMQRPVVTQSTAVLRFTLSADTAGLHNGPVDVCLNTASLCQRFDITTEFADSK